MRESKLVHTLHFKFGRRQYTRSSHACGLCGEQITLAVETERGEYTNDLTALLNTNQDTESSSKPPVAVRHCTELKSK